MPNSVGHGYWRRGWVFRIAGVTGHVLGQIASNSQLHGWQSWPCFCCDRWIGECRERFLGFNVRRGLSHISFHHIQLDLTDLDRWELIS